MCNIDFPIFSNSCGHTLSRDYRKVAIYGIGGTFGLLWLDS